MHRMDLAELLALTDENGRPVYADVDALIAAIESEDGKWPKTWERPTLEQLNTWAAFRENDKEQIAKVAGKSGKQATAKYRVDALPERIADAWAHYLHGQGATYAPADAADADRLEALVGGDWDSELEEGGAISSSEGEVWPRTYVDPHTEHPQTDWLSRLSVFPRFVGKRLAAAAVWTDLPVLDPKAKVIHRHFEIHHVGVVVNLLYAGTAEKVGARVPLDRHPQTEGAAEVWHHELPVMLIDRIPNKVRRTRRTKRTVGISDYSAAFDQFLDINESLAIGSRNMRLSAKQRAVISQAAAASGRGRVGPGLAGVGGDLDLTAEEGAASPAGPRFDTDEEVFVRDPLDTELGSGGEPPFQVLTYSFDATNLIAWRRELVDTALSRVGLSGQYVGLGDTQGIGYAISGTALRLRLIPTDAAGRGKRRYWDDGVPEVLRRMQMLDWLSAEEGGYGVSEWVAPGAPPTYTAAAGIPADPVEEAMRLQTLNGAGLQSLRTSVVQLHPEWTPDEVDAEVDAIRADRAGTMPPQGA